MDRAFPFRTRDGRPGTVRPARPRDARACLRIVGGAVGERPRTLSVLEEELWDIREWRHHRLDWSARGVSLVAEVAGRVAGQLTATRGVGSRTRAHTAEFGITVAREARGIGVGRALLETLEAWANEHGVTRIWLAVFEGNDRAVRLYRALGYEEEGVERRGTRFPEGDVDVIRMAKLLDARTTKAQKAAREDEGDA